MPSCALYMTSYPHFMKTTLSIYDITCTVFMTSHALYMAYHLLCMISHSVYVWDHTMPVSLTTHTLCLWYIHFIWHHTQCYDNTMIVELHSRYVWHHTHSICVFRPNLSILSYPVYVWHHSHYIYDITCTTYNITFTLYYITPLYVWLQVHNI